jgi:hypothetical protein
MQQNKILIDANSLFNIYPFNEDEWERYRISLSDDSGNLNLGLAAFDLATTIYSLEFNALLVCEFIKAKTETTKNNEKHIRSCVDQISLHKDQGMIFLENKIESVDVTIACLLGGFLGVDIKDCYHYIFSMRRGISLIVSEDKDMVNIDKSLHDCCLDDVMKGMKELFERFLKTSFFYNRKVEKTIKEIFQNSKIPKVQAIKEFVDNNIGKIK